MRRTSPAVRAWARRAIRWNRNKAKRKGIPFSITLEGVLRLWRTKCPVFGTTLTPRDKRAKHKPSFDRVRPHLGYVAGNVAIISLKANRIKNDATLEELYAVFKWLSRVWRFHEPKKADPHRRRYGRVPKCRSG